MIGERERDEVKKTHRLRLREAEKASFLDGSAARAECVRSPFAGEAVAAKAAEQSLYTIRFETVCIRLCSRTVTVKQYQE